MKSRRVEALHEQNLVHRDIKLQNVLAKQDFQARFCISRHVHAKARKQASPRLKTSNAQLPLAESFFRVFFFLGGGGLKGIDFTTGEIFSFFSRGRKTKWKEGHQHATSLAGIYILVKASSLEALPIVAF